MCKYLFFVSIIALFFSCASTKIDERPFNEKQEYTTAVKDINGEVSYPIYLNDKQEIKNIIEKLNLAIQTGDFNSWISMISEESRLYWSNKNNLEYLTIIFRNQGIEFHSLKDYFLHCVMTSRENKAPGQIYYTTPNHVKVFEANSKKDVIFYEFSKKNGEWKVHLRKF